MCQLTIVLIYQFNFYRLYNICGKLLNFSINTIQERFFAAHCGTANYFLHYDCFIVW